MPSKTSQPAPAHLSSKSDNWPTPQNFFDALHAEFGFVLDVCASTANHKAAAYYALDHADADRRNGLEADWAADATQLDGAVWMNPPYGRPIAAWMSKAHATAQAGAVVVTLVPVRADTAWWHEHVLATGAEVRYVRGRLTFGEAVNTAAFASAVVIYRPTDTYGRPGPVSTMPAHPATPRCATSRPQARRAAVTTTATAKAAPAAVHGRLRKELQEAFDCKTSQRQTSTLFEQVFEPRGRVETTETAGRPAVRTATPEKTVHAHLDATTRLDRLTTRALCGLYQHTPRRGPRPTTEQCLDQARATVRRHGGMGTTYRHEAVVQHLYAALWSYVRYFAPDPGWELASADPEQATLRWRDTEQAADDFGDLIITGHHDPRRLPATRPSLVRACNLTDPTASLLALPGNHPPIAWTPTPATATPTTAPAAALAVTA